MNKHCSKDLDLKILEDFSLLLNWVDTAPGAFSVNEISNNHEARFFLTEKLEKLVKANYLERVGNKRGVYRRRELVIEEMDFEQGEYYIFLHGLIPASLRESLRPKKLRSLHRRDVLRSFSSRIGRIPMVQFCIGCW